MPSAKPWTIVCASVFAVTFAAAACAAQIKVYSTIAVQTSLENLTPQFEKTTGHKLDVTWGTSATLLKRLLGGESADLVILTKSDLDTLVKAGKASAGADSELASSVIAVVVKHGAAKPDISTPDAFKRTLLSAKVISYSDPASGGTSGVYIAKLLERMGIAEAMKSKTRHPPPSGNAAALVIDGQADLAIQQQPEVMSAPGVDLVGPLPAEINLATTFSAGLGAGSSQTAAASALIKFLHSPTAGTVFKSKGLTPSATTRP